MPLYPHPRPCVTVDILLVGHITDGNRILLIRRRNPPFAGQWALPGGFVDVGDAVGNQGEDLPDAAIRELEEETGIGGVELRQVGAFGAPDRDPRHRTVTVLYRGDLDDPLPEPHGADDATEARWVPLDAILNQWEPLAFDHLELIRTALDLSG